MTTKQAWSVEETYVTPDGKHFRLNAANNNSPIADHPDHRPFFHQAVPEAFRSKIQYQSPDKSSPHAHWSAHVDIPMDVALGHEPLAQAAREALEEHKAAHPPGLLARLFGKTSANLGAVLDETLGFHSVKTADDLYTQLHAALPPNAREPVSPTCELLCQIARKKYQLILAYIHYGDQLRVMFRDGLYQHLQEHLDEERAQLYQVNKKVTALGGATTPELSSPVPQVKLESAVAIIGALEALERESVELWTQLFHQTSSDVALNGMAQNYATECQGHADDMTRYLRNCA